MNFFFNLFFFNINIVFAKDLRIIGGEDADIREFSFIASLRLYEERRHFCAGTIISHQHVLTAAHCVYHYHKFSYKVYAGSDNSSNYLIPNYDVLEVAIHPDFIERQELNWIVKNDIALITVEPFMIFYEFLNKVQLPTEDVKPGDVAVMNGWGWKTFPDGHLSSKLQKVHTEIISNADCEDIFPNWIDNGHVCVFQGEGIGTCFGDSGGPLISNGTLVGIASFTNPCATGQPDVFSKVYFYLDFIYSSIMSASNPSCCSSL